MKRPCTFLLRSFMLALCALGSSRLAAGDDTAPDKPFDYEAAAKKSPKPSDYWPGVKKDLIPLDWKIIHDEIITSDTDPTLKLRKITAHFWSMNVGGAKWGHPCVVFMPADASVNDTPARKGKAVIFGSPPLEQYDMAIAKYGEPIAARTKYPTMVLSNPGVTDDGRLIESCIGELSQIAAKATGKPYYNMNMQCALCYIKAIDALEVLLKNKNVHVIIGGHSKRGRGAFVAAALDRRVASAIQMGNEGVPRIDRPNPSMTYHYFKDSIKVPILYIGATNEDGYAAFNATFMREHMWPPATVEINPNYVHSNGSEIQFMDFMMWTAHVFDGRPITEIVEFGHRREGHNSVFTAKLEGKAKVQVVKAWYVYSDNPAWRDLMWYHAYMHKVGDHYEAVLPGKIPDAYFIEVGDIAQGYPGYVSTTMQKLTDAPLEGRVSRGSRPRLWEPPPKE
jgi:hypothetical protein